MAGSCTFFGYLVGKLHLLVLSTIISIVLTRLLSFLRLLGWSKSHSFLSSSQLKRLMALREVGWQAKSPGIQNMNNFMRWKMDHWKRMMVSLAIQNSHGAISRRMSKNLSIRVRLGSFYSVFDLRVAEPSSTLSFFCLLSNKLVMFMGQVGGFTEFLQSWNLLSQGISSSFYCILSALLETMDDFFMSWGIYRGLQRGWLCLRLRGLVNLRWPYRWLSSYWQ